MRRSVALSAHAGAAMSATTGTAHAVTTVSAATGTAHTGTTVGATTGTPFAVVLTGWTAESGIPGTGIAKNCFFKFFIGTVYLAELFLVEFQLFSYFIRLIVD